jgi:hypothetical protein
VCTGAEESAFHNNVRNNSSESGNDQKDEPKAKTASLRLYKYVAINDSGTG